VKFELEGKMIMGLNGGPKFRINPSISFFVTCTSTEEIEQTWEKLMDGGKAMMPLDKYPWSEKYGWLVDKFGMTWQLILVNYRMQGKRSFAVSSLQEKNMARQDRLWNIILQSFRVQRSINWNCTRQEKRNRKEV